MNQPYFIVVLAHSFHGKLRRIHIPYQALYVVLALAFIGLLTVFGFASSYLRMALKVADYNRLRAEVSALRQRYTSLERENRQHNQQLASLQLLASEVSVAFGIKNRIEGPKDVLVEGRLIPSVHESLDQYNFLKTASFTTHHRRTSQLFQTAMIPSVWPVDGRLMSHFGRRSDPFSGEGAFHKGIDISGPTGTPIRSTADGIVSHAEWYGGYGKLVVVDHGGGLQTWYAHMSRIAVIAGQSVRRGEVVGHLGGTGRATAPHLHYEVRRAGTPVNPYQYLKGSFTPPAKPREFSF